MAVQMLKLTERLFLADRT